MKTTTLAPAKIIILGEHFCVHGAPALSMAVNLYSKVEVEDLAEKKLQIFSENLGISGEYVKGEFFPMVGGLESRKTVEPIRLAVEATLNMFGEVERGFKVKVDSKIPVGVGLGSSASIAVSTIMAVAANLGFKLSKEEICKIAFKAEKYVHFKPSGIDHTTITYGGLILFKDGKLVKQIQPKKDLTFVVGNTGIRRSTGVLVKEVDKLKEEKGSLMVKMLADMENLVFEGLDALESGNLRLLGEVLNKNQKMLSSIGVSHWRLEELINVARKAGAIGAKLTGGGGGGCMICLAEDKDTLNVVKALKSVSEEVYIVKMDNDGVRVFV
ncbi:MAG: mevalonate kinase [Candidatus Bathyarchaeota archaeon]|nr:mevalonate kinase [Candidatus Bathyarchaeota archaeon]